MKLSTLVLILLHLVLHSATRLSKLTLDLDVRSVPGLVYSSKMALNRDLSYVMLRYILEIIASYLQINDIFHMKVIAPPVMPPDPVFRSLLVQISVETFAVLIGGFSWLSLQTYAGKFPQIRQVSSPSTSHSIHYSLNHIIKRYPVSNI